MAITLVNLTGNVRDLALGIFDTRRTKVWIEANIDRIVDLDNNIVRLGTATAPVDANGAFTFTSLVATGSASTNLDDSNNLRYRLWVDYTAAPGTRVQKPFGWYSITATSNLAALTETGNVPVDLMAGYVLRSGGTMTGPLVLPTPVPGAAGWQASQALRVDQLTLVPIQRFGAVADVTSPASPTVPAAFDQAMSTLVAGQALYFPFDASKVDSSGFCSYWIDRSLNWVKSIPLIAESKYVQVKLKSGAGWGSTRFHAICNWTSADYGGAVPTESVLQAPDTDAAGTIDHNIFSLDGLGFRVNLNLQNGVSAVSLVHSHEQSKISVVATTGTSSTSPIKYGNRVLSLFANSNTVASNGVVAGPLYIEKATGYGQGWDHFVYVDGSNGGTQGTSGNFVQDIHFNGACSPPLSTGAKIYPYCLKSPWHLKSVQGLHLNDTHTEAQPANSPPTASAGGWPGAGVVVEQGKKVVGVSASGGNAGRASLWICTVAGNTGGSEPAWPSPNSGGTTTQTDGTVTWRCYVLSTTNGGNSTFGVLDGATGWPGASVAVEKGTHISPDGAHGWICTTAGTTGGSLPAFSTAAGRGTTQADGTATWTYVIDDYDTASVRMVDVAHSSFVQTRWAAGSDGTNRPLIKQSLTGSAPSQIVGFTVPDLFAMDLVIPATTAGGLTNSSNGGWWGNIFELYGKTLPYSYVTFDPRRISKLTAWSCEFAHTKALTASRIAVLGTIP